MHNNYDGRRPARAHCSCAVKQVFLQADFPTHMTHDIFMVVQGVGYLPDIINRIIIVDKDGLLQDLDRFRIIAEAPGAFLNHVLHIVDQDLTQAGAVLDQILFRLPQNMARA